MVAACVRINEIVRLDIVWSMAAFLEQGLPWAYYQIRKIAGCACAGNAGNVFPRGRLQRKPVASDPGMHHGTCVTHVPWCMSGSLTRGCGENVPGIRSACAPAILRIKREAHLETVWLEWFYLFFNVFYQEQTICYTTENYVVCKVYVQTLNTTLYSYNSLSGVSIWSESNFGENDFIRSISVVRFNTNMSFVSIEIRSPDQLTFIMGNLIMQKGLNGVSILKQVQDLSILCKATSTCLQTGTDFLWKIKNKFHKYLYKHKKGIISSNFLSAVKYQALYMSPSVLNKHNRCPCGSICYLMGVNKTPDWLLFPRMTWINMLLAWLTLAVLCMQMTRKTWRANGNDRYGHVFRSTYLDSLTLACDRKLGHYRSIRVLGTCLTQNHYPIQCLLTARTIPITNAIKI